MSAEQIQEAAEPPVEEREYYVNATMTVAAWVNVWATSPEEAREMADSMSASDFDTDMSTGEIEFNVTPEVEIA